MWSCNYKFIVRAFATSGLREPRTSVSTSPAFRVDVVASDAACAVVSFSCWIIATVCMILELSLSKKFLQLLILFANFWDSNQCIVSLLCQLLTHFPGLWSYCYCKILFNCKGCARVHMDCKPRGLGAEKHGIMATTISDSITAAELRFSLPIKGSNIWRS